MRYADTIQAIHDELSKLYDDEQAQTWLASRQKCLANAIPRDLIAYGYAERVLHAIQGATDGVFT